LNPDSYAISFTGLSWKKSKTWHVAGARIKDTGVGSVHDCFKILLK
jgi:hypothetical protein